MKLYLQGKSENKIGYTADWIAFFYNEGDVDYCLTLDLQGETDYDNSTLNLRHKGDIIPWVLENITENFIFVHEDIKRLFSIEKIKEIISKSYSVYVGLYPTKKWDDDKITSRKGRIEIGEFTHDFIDFEWEIML